MSLITKVRELTLSPDERLLRKYGVVQPNGELTSDGFDLVVEILFQLNREAVVEKLKELKKQEKTEKKEEE